ncbi:MAG: DUF4876 domain-containing protein [Candidatus Marinimicrobia bacterium]|nr:DUF4876 domain-containing protein [Candidatus Neomarinimicrobiota bacterium]
MAGIIAALGLFSSCTENVAPPKSMRLDYYLTVKDTSGLTESLTGNVVVKDAQVFASSLSYQNFVEQRSDENGKAILEDILPDIYNFSVTRRYSKEEIFSVTGQNIERVLNGQIQSVNISKEDSIEIYLSPVSLGKLVFSEIYYNGSPADPIPYYYHDQFTELYNNSEDTIYLDSLLIADLEYGFAEEEFIHAVHAYMFPGTGCDYPIAPGEFKLIAQDAVNHQEYNHSSLDLSGCDFEYFVPNKGDVNYDATNMIQIHHKYGNDFLYSVMNNALVIMKVKDPYAWGYDDFERLLLPKEAVFDAVEYRDNLSEMEYKRLDPSLDAGLTGGFDMYSGQSVQRRIERVEKGRWVLMDNNNSSIDFEILESPTPGYLKDKEAGE